MYPLLRVSMMLKLWTTFHKVDLVLQASHMGTFPGWGIASAYVPLGRLHKAHAWMHTS